MPLTDNLLTAVQSFITPDFVTRSSVIVGQTPERTKAGLMAAIPTVIMGLANKGSTTNGAQNLLGMIQQGGFSSGVPSNLLDQMQNSRLSENYLRSGSDLAQGLLGSKMGFASEKLAMSTGLPAVTMSKILGMVAPLAMGTLGSTIMRKGMNATGLSMFLGQQKSLISGMIPQGIFGDERVREMHTKYPTPIHGSDNTMRSWLPLAIGAIAVVLGGLWLMRGHRTENEVARKVPSPQEQTQVVERIESTREIPEFLASQAPGEVPKRFRFEALNFTTDSAQLMPGASAELGEIAAALKDHPSAKARIEGFTDNVGEPESNKTLSTERAASVKAELVSLGVEADRIMSVGFGEENPVASNTSEDGREQNRRIELVILEK